MLQAGLHETRLDWDKALKLLQALADKAPQWFEAQTRLGSLLTELARYTEAEPHLRAAVRLAKNLEEESVGSSNLASLLQDTNRLAEAESLYRRALAIDEATYGPDHPHVAIDLSNLAQLLQVTDRSIEAEPLMRRALAVLLLFAQRTGHEHPVEELFIDIYSTMLAAIGRDEAEQQAAIDALRESVRQRGSLSPGD